MANGMHTSMPVWLFDKERVQRSLKIWWTVYVMDREMTSLMGIPQAIQDEDVQADTPTYQGVTQRLTALRMQVKLCRSIARINRGKWRARSSNSGPRRSTRLIVFRHRGLWIRWPFKRKLPGEHQECPSRPGLAGKRARRNLPADARKVGAARDFTGIGISPPPLSSGIHYPTLVVIVVVIIVGWKRATNLRCNSASYCRRDLCSCAFLK